MVFRVLFTSLLALASAGWGADATPLILRSREASARVENAPGSAAKKHAATESLELAREAVAADPENADAHVALAIALGKMTDFADNRTKMSSARSIRSEAEAALRLDPRNAVACRILGKWHAEMSRLNPVLKAIATTLYGKLPDASPEQAEGYFRRAAATSPENIPAHAELALFLEQTGNRKEALVEWQKVLLLQPVDGEDRAFLSQARAAVILKAR